MTDSTFRHPAASGNSIALAILCALALATTSLAQDKPECDAAQPASPNAPLACAKSAGTEAIRIEADALEIETTAGPSVSAKHMGTGRIGIRLTDSKLTTRSETATSTGKAHGIISETASGSNEVTLDNVEIRTRGVVTVSEAVGTVGVRILRNSGGGRLNVDIRGSRIETEDKFGHGIDAQALAGEGDIAIAVRGSHVETSGSQLAIGVYGRSSGSGDMAIDLSDSMIKTSGDLASHAVAASQTGSSPGAINIVATGTRVSVSGKQSNGINARRVATANNADIVLRLRDSRIESVMAGQSSENVQSYGVRAQQNGAGDVVVDMHGGRISTAGKLSYGIFASHSSSGQTVQEYDGDVVVSVGEGADISTRGELAHGILGWHFGAKADRSIAIHVDRGAVTASGAGAHAVALGNLSRTDAKRFAGLDGEGYRRHSVLINGPVFGGSGSRAAGVFLANGGRVSVGPFGSVGAESGVAILAAGTTSDSALPRLQVALNPGGRRMSEVLGRNWIINEGGATEIVMNGVVLHDAESGASDAVAPNGAFDVTLKSAGRNVVSRTGSWSIEDLADGTAADRDFSAADFNEEYAPRAALYESLPAALAHIDGSLLDIGSGAGLPYGHVASLRSAGGSEKAVSGPAGVAKRPSWGLWRGYLQAASGSSRQSPATTTGGAHYRTKRWQIEGGMAMQYGDKLLFSAGVRRVGSQTDISAPQGRASVAGRGIGLAVSATWRNRDGWFASGRFSSTRHQVSLATAQRGILVPNLAMTANFIGTELGKTWSPSGGLDLTTRAWAGRSKLQPANFVDQVGTRVETGGSRRTTAGFGVSVRRAFATGNGSETLALSGRFGVEKLLSSSNSEVRVSGTRLAMSESRRERFLVGIGIERTVGDMSIEGRIRATRRGSREKTLAMSIGAAVGF